MRNYSLGEVQGLVRTQPVGEGIRTSGLDLGLLVLRLDHAVHRKHFQSHTFHELIPSI